jgi:peptidylprolyl isomerase
MPPGSHGEYAGEFVGTDKRDRQRAARLDKAIAESAAAKRTRNRRTALRVGGATVLILIVLFGVSKLVGDDGSDSASTSATTSTTTPSALGATIPETFTDPDLAKEVEARKPPKTTPPPKNTPADAVVTKTLIKGEGDGAADGDTVTVHYVGILSDGTVFDESWSKQQPFPVALGQGQVIQGWDEGLKGVKIGERRHLVIGADKAYGANAQSRIPANSPLAFDVDVVDITPPA